MVKSKKAIITGITGQDGAHLSNQLIKEGVQVFGTFRRGSHHKTWRLDELGITDKSRKGFKRNTPRLCFSLGWCEFHIRLF